MTHVIGWKGEPMRRKSLATPIVDHALSFNRRFWEFQLLTEALYDGETRGGGCSALKLIAPMIITDRRFTTTPQETGVQVKGTLSATVFTKCTI